MQIRFQFAQTARRHRIAKGRAREAMTNAVLVDIELRADGRSTGIFIGVDSRGLELEIGIGVHDDEVRPVWTVFHVMPYRYSRHYKRK